MIAPFWPAFAGTLTGAAMAFGLQLTGAKGAVRKAVQKGFAGSSLIEWHTLLGAVGFRDIVETAMRAATGKQLERPFGTTRHYFDWGNLQFSPGYLSNQPGDADAAVDTSVVIGPQARRPLRLEMPIMIAGMSYGTALSMTSKTALARAATIAGTSASSGNGPFLQEERMLAQRYVMQLSRGYWNRCDKVLRQVDMLEIHLGQGAWGAAPIRVKGKTVTGEFARRLGAIPGLDVLIQTRLPEVNDLESWRSLIASLRDRTEGAPICVKIGTTHHLEDELDAIFQADVDAITLDGTEAGTHATPPILLDDSGLPLMPGLVRGVNYLRRNGLWGKVSVIAGGGLSNAGEMLKAMALGANAVIIGTMTALAMVHTQVTKAVPFEPPTGLIYHEGKEEKKFDGAEASRTVARFFQSCTAEMAELVRTLGKKALSDIGPDDLVALDPIVAEITGVPLYIREPGSL